MTPLPDELQDKLQQAQPARPALPWHWFDFREPPRPVDSGIRATVEDGGADRVWRVMLDGRIVPFKLLCRPAPGGALRPLLVMLHGMGLTIATFHGVAQYLLENHDLALVDYSGLSTHGADGWPHGGVGLKVLAETVWAVADVAAAEQVDLAGNSLGGALCLVAALQRPARVRRLLLSNPACYPQTLPFSYRLARIPVLGEILLAITPPQKLVAGVEHIGYVDKTRFPPELRKRYLECMTPLRNRWRLMHMMRHLPAGATDMTVAAHVGRLKDLRQRVMLTWGVQDPLLAEGSGDRLAADLPNCTYRKFENLAHMPHEESPQRIGPEWAKFLNA